MSNDLLTFTIEGERPQIVTVETLETIKGFKRASRKEILFRDFLNMINESYISQGMIHLGKLPRGYYDGRIDVNENGFECLVVVPEGIKPIIYYDKVYTIPFPSLLFFFRIQSGILKYSNVYALKKDNVDDNDYVYHYPFGNVHSDGSICWGSNTVNGIRNFREVEKAVSMFFGCSTNDDLWERNRINVSDKDPRILQRGLIESLMGQKKFPLELLVKLNKRVGEVMNS